jgi:hypothetical protein
MGALRFQQEKVAYKKKIVILYGEDLNWLIFTFNANHSSNFSRLYLIKSVCRIEGYSLKACSQLELNQLSLNPNQLVFKYTKFKFCLILLEFLIL